MKLINLKLSELEAADTNPRQIDEFSPEIADLAASVAELGVLLPLLVRQLGAHSFVILDGHRRAVAARVAKLTSVPCIIDNREGPKEIVHLVTAVQKRALTPLETALAVRGALASKKVKSKQLAATLGKSEAWVSKFKLIAEFYNANVGARTNATYETNADRLYDKAQAWKNPKPAAQAPLPSARSPHTESITKRAIDGYKADSAPAAAERVTPAAPRFDQVHDKGLSEICDQPEDFKLEPLPETKPEKEADGSTPITLELTLADLRVIFDALDMYDAKTPTEEDAVLIAFNKVRTALQRLGERV